MPETIVTERHTSQNLSVGYSTNSQASPLGYLQVIRIGFSAITRHHGGLLTLTQFSGQDGVSGDGNGCVSLGAQTPAEQADREAEAIGDNEVDAGNHDVNL